MECQYCGKQTSGFYEEEKAAFCQCMTAECACPTVLAHYPFCDEQCYNNFVDESDEEIQEGSKG